MPHFGQIFIPSVDTANGDSGAGRAAAIARRRERPRSIAAIAPTTARIRRTSSSWSMAYLSGGPATPPRSRSRCPPSAPSVRAPSGDVTPDDVASGIRPMCVPAPGGAARMAAVSISATAHGSARLTEEQVLLRDAVRELADERVAPRAAEIDRTAEWPEDVRRLLAEHDIFGIPFSEAHGGLGADLLTLCLAVEQLSRVCATSGLILAVQSLGA